MIFEGYVYAISLGCSLLCYGYGYYKFRKATSPNNKNNIIDTNINKVAQITSK
ncbi:hypothetical protein [Methanosphaera sp. WGK6]|uniref:hypothetical protein n=1 Tax=Methanosphaera sp. WGK6 TaxID=1561964 RepID=UPI001300E047|nr:hypothetical protein [Methanosphaera sp. WGK6]